MTEQSHKKNPIKLTKTVYEVEDTFPLLYVLFDDGTKMLDGFYNAAHLPKNIPRRFKVTPVKNVDNIGHGVLGRNAPVYLAGEVNVKKGKIVKINDQSGCYKPYGDHLDKLAKKVFKRHGFTEVANESFKMEQMFEKSSYVRIITGNTLTQKETALYGFFGTAVSPHDVSAKVVERYKLVQNAL